MAIRSRTTTCERSASAGSAPAASLKPWRHHTDAPWHGRCRMFGGQIPDPRPPIDERRGVEAAPPASDTPIARTGKASAGSAPAASLKHPGSRSGRPSGCVVSAVHTVTSLRGSWPTRRAALPRRPSTLGRHRHAGAVKGIGIRGVCPRGLIEATWPNCLSDARLFGVRRHRAASSPIHALASAKLTLVAASPTSRAVAGG